MTQAPRRSAQPSGASEVRAAAQEQKSAAQAMPLAALAGRPAGAVYLAQDAAPESQLAYSLEASRSWVEVEPAALAAQQPPSAE